MLEAPEDAVSATEEDTGFKDACEEIDENISTDFGPPIAVDELDQSCPE